MRDLVSSICAAAETTGLSVFLGLAATTGSDRLATTKGLSNPTPYSHAIKARRSYKPSAVLKNTAYLGDGSLAVLFST